MSGHPDKPWYASGLRFGCQQTGKCCTNHGDHGYVYLKSEDEKRLAKHLNLNLREFRAAHTYRLDGYRLLNSTANACEFLDAKGQCTVHEARPIQCRTWPFWRENLDEGTWLIEVAPFCAGVGKGKLFTQAEIEAMADQNEDDDWA